MFTAYEMNEMREGLKFILDCSLWDADRSVGEWWRGGDDHLYSYGSRIFPDASPSASESVTFDVTVGASLLDDESGTDEIFGRLRLRNYYTGAIVTAKTNIVKRKFGAV